MRFQSENAVFKYLHRAPSHPFRILIYRACFVFYGGHFESLIRGMLVRSLEPKLRKSGTGGKIRKFSEAADRSPRIIKSFS